MEKLIGEWENFKQFWVDKLGQRVNIKDLKLDELKNKFWVEAIWILDIIKTNWFCEIYN